MSNTLRKLNKSLVILIIIGIVFGCDKYQGIHNEIKFTFKDSTDLEIDEFKFYKDNKNQDLFLYIPKNKDLLKILVMPLKKIDFVMNDSTYRPTIISSIESRDERGEFYLLMDKITMTPIPTNINGKVMFMVRRGVNKSDDIEVEIPKELRMNY